jgi:hypothetical protein
MLKESTGWPADRKAPMTNLFDTVSSHLDRLGCSDEAEGADCILLDQFDQGDSMRLFSGSEEYFGSPDEILVVLEALDDGCGPDAVWAALRGEDDSEDDGQPDSYQERVDFAQDDDWREYEVERFDLFDD